MNIEEIREYCLSKNEVTEGFPFDEVTLVFKVADKMFALTNLERELSINLKCEPEKALKLREQYDAITPGWHMNKKHWNTVKIDNSLANDFILNLIDHSYELIVSKLPKTKKKELGF